MTSENVKFYKDGNRYAIVFEDPSEEFALALNKVIFDNLSIKPTNVEGVVPETAKQEPFTLPDERNRILDRSTIINAMSPDEFVAPHGPYKGMTLKQAYSEYGSIVGIAYNELAKTDLLKGKSRATMLYDCRAIIKEDLLSRSKENDSLDKIGEFFKAYGEKARKVISDIQFSEGDTIENLLRDALETGEEEKIRSAYGIVVQIMINSFK